jgi:hypothetical protein
LSTTLPTAVFHPLVFQRARRSVTPRSRYSESATVPPQLEMEKAFVR